MRANKAPLSDPARAVLAGVTIESDPAKGDREGRFLVKLESGQLARPVYEEVDETLKRLGGKWLGGKTAAHVFPADVDPRRLLDAVLESGIIPEKNPHAFFPTPESVIGLMQGDSHLAPLWFGDGYVPLLLEPSAGRGALARAMRGWLPAALIDCVEIDPVNCAHLRAQGFHAEQGDFNCFLPGSLDVYDGVLMNPPFATEGDTKVYISHINAAFSLLKPGRVLIAVAPAGIEFHHDKRTADLRTLIEGAGGFISALPEDSFKESGTGVSSCLVVIPKPGKAVESHNSAARARIALLMADKAGADEAKTIAAESTEYESTEEEDPFAYDDPVGLAPVQAPPPLTPAPPLPAAHAAPGPAPGADSGVRGNSYSGAVDVPDYGQGFLAVCKSALHKEWWKVNVALSKRSPTEEQRDRLGLTKLSRSERDLLNILDQVRAADPGWEPKSLRAEPIGLPGRE